MATRYEENLLDIVVTLRRPGDYLESLLCVVYMRELFAELKRKLFNRVTTTFEKRSPRIYCTLTCTSGLVCYMLLCDTLCG